MVRIYIDGNLVGTAVGTLLETTKENFFIRIGNDILGNDERKEN